MRIKPVKVHIFRQAVYAEIYDTKARRIAGLHARENTLLMGRCRSQGGASLPICDPNPFPALHFFRNRMRPSLRWRRLSKIGAEKSLIYLNSAYGRLQKPNDGFNVLAPRLRHVRII
jgi:hypothetical protein